MVHSQPTWLYAPKHTLKREDTPNLTWLYAPMYAPNARSRDLLSCRRQAPGGVRLVAYGGQRLAGGVCRVAGGRRRIFAEIMTSVDIIVWILSLARPPRQDLTMPHGHGVDNCSLRFCRKGRQLDLGESRSPTRIFQRNLVPAAHQLWAYVCAFGLGQCS